MKRILKKVVTGIAAVVLLALVGIQFYPVARTNPPVTAPIKAPPQVLAVFQRSCYDCQSNETKWPWYSHFAPVSWLVTKDVRQGRRRFNFSNWDSASPKYATEIPKDIYSETHEGGMPLPIYLLMHPKAKLAPGDLNIIEEWTNSVVPGAAPEKDETAAKAQDSETAS